MSPTDRAALHQLVEDLPASEVPRALRLLAQLQAGDAGWQLSLAEEAEIEEGLAEADRGETIPWETVHAEMAARYKATP